jgi:hypothetical protein
MAQVEYPHHAMAWVAEVEASHAQRFYDILTQKKINFIVQRPSSYPTSSVPITPTPSSSSSHEPWLYYTTMNLLMDQLIPFECCKYIHKMLHVPHSCSDLKSIHTSSDLLELIQHEAIFKIVASPKSLERPVSELLIWDSDEDLRCRPHLVSPSNIHPSRYTHLIQVIYSPYEGLFRYGICSKEKALESHLLSVALVETIGKKESALTIPPICRAYHKIQEILTHHLPLWQWHLPDYSELYSVDIGSSPGGWTQFLLSFSRKILSVDPGKMDERLYSQLNREGDVCMRHVPYLAESDQCRRELMTLCCEEVPPSYIPSLPLDSSPPLSSFSRCRVVRPITLCVCDVNFEPHLAAEMLAKSIVPFMRAGELITSTCPVELFTTPPALSTSLSASPRFSYLIITLKLQKNPSERIIQRSFHNVQRIISSAFQQSSVQGEGYGCDFKMIYLNANSKNERTVVCRITRGRATDE